MPAPRCVEEGDSHRCPRSGSEGSAEADSGSTAHTPALEIKTPGIKGRKIRDAPPVFQYGSGRKYCGRQPFDELRLQANMPSPRKVLIARFCIAWSEVTYGNEETGGTSPIRAI
jgi:hypothetical protein